MQMHFFQCSNQELIVRHLMVSFHAKRLTDATRYTLRVGAIRWLTPGRSLVGAGSNQHPPLPYLCFPLREHSAEMVSNLVTRTLYSDATKFVSIWADGF
jgi:hypothetical protein